MVAAVILPRDFQKLTGFPPLKTSDLLLIFYVL
jgi:hypothetical protein